MCVCVCFSILLCLYLRAQYSIPRDFFFTSAGRQGAAPLAVAPTLGPGGTLQQVARVTGEIHEVVQVELAAIGEPMGRISRVSTRDGCGNKASITAHTKQGTSPTWSH